MASIILIDDYDHFRMITSMMLENSGHEVRVANNGENGLKLFKDEPADIVITDLHMPGIGGIDVIAELRRISSDVKIAVMSGFLEQSGEAPGIDADIFIAKPVSSKNLYAAIDKLLSS